MDLREHVIIRFNIDIMMHFMIPISFYIMLLVSYLLVDATFFILFSTIGSAQEKEILALQINSIRY